METKAVQQAMRWMGGPSGRVDEAGNDAGDYQAVIAAREWRARGKVPEGVDADRYAAQAAYNSAKNLLRKRRNARRLLPRVDVDLDRISEAVPTAAEDRAATRIGWGRMLRAVSEGDRELISALVACDGNVSQAISMLGWSASRIDMYRIIKRKRARWAKFFEC